MELNSETLIKLTLVPQASDMIVAAATDTMRAALNAFSDVIAKAESQQTRDLDATAAALVLSNAETLLR